MRRSAPALASGERGGGAPKLAVTAMLDFHWNDLDGDDRREINIALARDQGRLCAYCQRRIVPDLDVATGRPRMSIEHWVARATDPDEELHFRWANLLGVCLGGAGTPELTCDKARGSRPLFLHPVADQGPDPIAYLRYLKNGTVEYQQATPHATDDIETLNLNADRLVRGRKAIYLREFELRLKGLTPAETVRALRRIVREHTIVSGGVVPEHAEFVRFHARKKLRRYGVEE